MFILNPGLGDKLVITNTDSLVSSYEAPETSEESTSGTLLFRRTVLLQFLEFSIQPADFVLNGHASPGYF